VQAIGAGPGCGPGCCPPAGLAAGLALRAHLPRPQLSRQMVDLLAELTPRAGVRVLVSHCSHADQRPDTERRQPLR
jgi:hypothetical protein